MRGEDRAIDAMCHEIGDLRKPFMNAFVSAFEEWLDALDPVKKVLFLSWAAKNRAWPLMMGIDNSLREYSDAHQP